MIGIPKEGFSLQSYIPAKSNCRWYWCQGIGGGGGGRFCVTDDTAGTIGANVQVRAEHVTALNTTKRRKVLMRHARATIVILWKWSFGEWQSIQSTWSWYSRSVCRRERWPNEILPHMQPRYCLWGISHWHGVIIHGSNKKKGDVTNGDKIFCYNKMKKINDAVLFGARTVKQVLSSSCYSEMDSFIASFKKEIADACCHGNVDEKKADPISFSLFQMILVWAIERANIFAWVWTILLWNHMARSISIDLLALHNTLISEDHFVICHDLTKWDKEVPKINKAVVTHWTLSYAQVSAWVSGYWWTRTHSASNLKESHSSWCSTWKCCTSVLQAATHYYKSALGYCTNVNHYNVGTWHKEGECHTCGMRDNRPPPIALIANRGNWLVYWESSWCLLAVCEADDAYIGCCLCRLDPNHSTFSVLPPL